MRASFLLVLLVSATPVGAQEPYQFGFRFEAQPFRSFAFRGFSHRAPGFRNQFGPTIQFSRIRFQDIRSNGPRQEFLARATGRAERREPVRYDAAPLGADTRFVSREDDSRVAREAFDRVAARRGNTMVADSRRRQPGGFSAARRVASPLDRNRAAAPSRLGRVAGGVPGTPASTRASFGPGDSLRAAATRVRTARR